MLNIMFLECFRLNKTSRRWIYVANAVSVAFLNYEATDNACTQIEPEEFSKSYTKNHKKIISTLISTKGITSVNIN